MSLETCVSKAKEFISENKVCLLLFDMVGSSKIKDKKGLVNRLSSMMKDLNETFKDYFPEHELAVYTRKERGFPFLLGDGSWTGINSAEIIPKIIEYQKKNYPDIPLYWAVARDGYDKENVKIVR